MAQDLLGVPKGGEVWKVGNSYVLVYHTPNHKVPIAYTLKGQQLNDLFDGSPSHVKSFADWKTARSSTGILVMGSREAVRSESKDPFGDMVQKLKRLAISQPWLADPEVMALYTAATLEGRSVSQEELQTTNWFRSRNEAQRQWAYLSMSDPKTAAQMKTDNRNMVRSTLMQLGVTWDENSKMGPLVDWVNDQWTTGNWSQEYLTEQLRRLADPHRGPLDSKLAAQTSRSTFSRTIQHEDTVRQLVSEWLGPQVAQGWTDQHVASWAGRLRNDPNAQQKLVRSLQLQRKAKYGAYEDENITYADIDALWRPVVRGMWGIDPRQDDAVYERILQMNNQTEAEKLLRTEGVKRGYASTLNEISGAVTRAVGQRIGSV